MTKRFFFNAPCRCFLVNNYDFSGKVVLVTGSSGGLGTEVAHAFLKTGASVVLTYYS
ncbi:MAG: SDR family oxidoreductase, partial [Nitrosotalea sp.]